MQIINTRADLEPLREFDHGAYVVEMAKLKASMTTRVDRADHPEGDADVEPQWEEVETLQSIERLGFTKETFSASCAEVDL